MTLCCTVLLASLRNHDDRTYTETDYININGRKFSTSTYKFHCTVQVYKKGRLVSVHFLINFWISLVRAIQYSSTVQ